MKNYNLYFSKVFIPNKKEQKLQNDYKMASLKEAIHQALHNSGECFLSFSRCMK